MNNLFCEKYKPKTTKDIIGCEQSVANIVSWLGNYKNAKYQCLLVTGSHGCGKTCKLTAILNEYKYDIKTFDVTKFKKSDNKELYLRELTSDSDILALICGKRADNCVIIIDGLDVELLSQEKLQFLTLLKMNNSLKICPIIFVFDTKHTKFINTVKKNSIHIYIDEPTEQNMLELLSLICYNEKIKIKSIALAKKIISFCQNDYRRLCITLYDIAKNVPDHKITDAIVNKYNNSATTKNINTDLFTAASKLLSGYDGTDEYLKLYETEKVNIPLMVHHNYIEAMHGNHKSKLKYQSVKKFVRSISIGNVIDNYIYCEQKWDITDVHGYFSTCLPAYLLDKYNRKLTKSPSFPVDMNKSSLQCLNKKNILNASKIFNSSDPIDYSFIGKILTDLINTKDNDGMTKTSKDIEYNKEEFKKIIKKYKITLDKLESILKIDKTSNSKILLTTKQKKIFKEL